MGGICSEMVAGSSHGSCNQRLTDFVSSRTPVIPASVAVLLGDISADEHRCSAGHERTRLRSVSFSSFIISIRLGV